MCAIIGTWNKEYNPNFVGGNLHKLFNRGPDSNGISSLGKVEFGHTRLAIQDLSPAGNQPMFDDENMIMITYNGELWNKEEIENLLSDKLNYKISYPNDTLTILNFYKHFCRGKENIKNIRDLNGMIAIGIYDSLYDARILYRDSVGEKPIYYNDQRFCTKAEIVSIDKRFDALQVSALLGMGYPIEGLFDDVVELHPGDIYFNGELFMEEPKKAIFSLEGKYTTFVDKFRESIRQKFSNMDVPFCLCLSGGLDSSLILAEFRNIFGYEKELKTVTISFNTEDDDTKNAKLMAEKFKTTHKEIFISRDDVLKRLPDVAAMIDVPMDLGSMIPTFIIAETIKTQMPDVKVVILGEGADELFFGYKRFIEYAKNPEMNFFDRTLKMNMRFNDSFETMGLKDARALSIESELKRYHMKRIDMIFGDFGLEARCPFLFRDIIEVAENSDPEENLNLYLPEDECNKLWIRQRLHELEVDEKIIRQKKRPLKLFPDMDRIRVELFMEYIKRFKRD